MNPLDANLKRGSPCIDTGDPDSPLDPDSTRKDMGAYFFDQRQNFVTYNENISQFEIGVPFPNPFNSSLNQSFQLSRTELVGLSLYDANGRLIIKHKPQVYIPGKHTISLNGSNLANGTYFLNIHTNNLSHTVKVELLK